MAFVKSCTSLFCKNSQVRARLADDRDKECGNWGIISNKELLEEFFGKKSLVLGR